MPEPARRSLAALIEPIRRNPALTDVVVAAAAAMAVALPVVTGWPDRQPLEAGGATIAVLAVGPVALLGRRSHALLVAIVVVTAYSLVYVRLGARDLFTVPAMLGLYAAAAYGSRTRTILMGGGMVGWAVLITRLTPAAPAPGESTLFEMLLWPLVALAGGEVVRSRQELSVHRERQRALEAQHAVDEVRRAIARDFHDVVAHTMTAVHVQLAAAVAVLDSDPAASRAALLDATQSSVAAQQELRATVAALRSDTSAAPTPSLAELDAVVAPVRASGIVVDLDVDPSAASIPAGVAVTAYRIVQEAATNTVTHSDARIIRVVIRCDGDELHVCVSDDGATSSVHDIDRGAETDHHGGLGLRGMRERVHTLGGQIIAGPRPDRGYQIQAVLPLATAT